MVFYCGFLMWLKINFGLQYVFDGFGFVGQFFECDVDFFVVVFVDFQILDDFEGFIFVFVWEVEYDVGWNVVGVVGRYIYGDLFVGIEDLVMYMVDGSVGCRSGR